MGYCCVRSRSWRYVSVIFTLLMLGIADFCVGRTCRLRGSDLSSVSLRCATLSISFSLSLFQWRV